MRLVFILMIMSSVCLSGGELLPQERDGFYQRALARSWEFGVRQIEYELPDGKVSLQRSMTAFAFRYWVLLENKMLFKDEAFERLVRNAFIEKKIEIEYLEDPLGRKGERGPRLGVPEIKIKDNEYMGMVIKFRRFILEEGVQK